MRLPLILLTTAGLLQAVPLPRLEDAHTMIRKEPVKCTPSPFFKPTKQYTYKFTTKVENRVAGTGDDFTGITLTGKFKILPMMNKCDYLLKVTTIDLMEPINGTDKMSPLGKVLRREMNKDLVFSVEGGKITEVKTHKLDSEQAVNIKRGILSTLQLDASSKVETDVHGKCPITVTKKKRKNTNEIFFFKQKNMNECEKRIQNEMGFQNTAFTTEKNVVQPLNSTSFCQYKTKGKNLLQKVTCQEKHIFRPFSAGYEKDAGAITTVSQTVQFVRSHRQPKRAVVSASSLEMPSTLIFSHKKESMKPTNDMVKEFGTLMKRLISVEGKHAKQHSAREFMELVKLIRSMDEKRLKDVWFHYFNCETRNKVCKPGDGLQEVYRQYLLDAIQFCGSEACVGVMREFIVSGQVTGQRMDSFLQGITLVPEPTKDMIRDVLDIAKKTEKKGKLSRQAMLTLGTLLRVFCSKNKDACQYRQRNPVTMAEEYLTNKLNKNCHAHKTDYVLVEKIILALKAIKNSGRPAGAFAKLIRCAKNPVHANISIAAFEALKTMPCNEALDGQLHAFLEDFNNDPELRIHAFQAVMRCSNEENFHRVIHTLEDEKNNQVASFIHSYLTDLKDSTNPKYKEQSELVKKLTANKPLKVVDSNILFHSKAYKKGIQLDNLKTGAHAEMDTVFHSDSYIPRSARMSFAANLLGVDLNLFEMYARFEGLETLIEQLFSPNGAYPDNFILKMFDININKDTFVPPAARVRRSLLPAQYEKKLNRLFDNMRVHEKQPAGHLSVRLFGQEIRLLSYEDLMDLIDQASNNVNIIEMMTKLAKGGKTSFSKSQILMDMTHTVPTGAGLPLNLELQSSAVASIALTGKVDIRNMFWGPKALDIYGSVRPSAVVDMTAKMGVKGPYTDSGMFVNSSIYMDHFLKGKVEFREGKKLQVSLNPPEEPVTLFNVSTTPYLYTNTQNIPVASKTRFDIEETANATALGLGLQMNAGFPTAYRDYEAPYSPLNGPMYAGVKLLRTDPTVSSYQFLIDVAKTTKNDVTKYTYDISLSTPKATDERRISAQALYTIIGTDHSISMESKSRFSTMSVEGKYNALTNTLGGKIAMEIPALGKNGKFSTEIKLFNETQQDERSYGLKTTVSVLEDTEFSNVIRFTKKKTGYSFGSVVNYLNDKNVETTLDWNKELKQLQLLVNSKHMQQTLDITGKLVTDTGIEFSAKHLPSGKTATFFAGLDLLKDSSMAVLRAEILGTEYKLQAGRVWSDTDAKVLTTLSSDKKEMFNAFIIYKLNSQYTFNSGIEFDGNVFGGKVQTTPTKNCFQIYKTKGGKTITPFIACYDYTFDKTVGTGRIGCNAELTMAGNKMETVIFSDVTAWKNIKSVFEIKKNDVSLLTTSEEVSYNGWWNSKYVTKMIMGEYNADFSVVTTDVKDVKNVDISMAVMNKPAKLNFAVKEKSWYETETTLKAFMFEKEWNLLDTVVMHGWKPEEKHVGIKINADFGDVVVETTPVEYTASKGVYNLLTSFTAKKQDMTLIKYRMDSKFTETLNKVDVTTDVTLRKTNIRVEMFGQAESWRNTKGGWKILNGTQVWASYNDELVINGIWDTKLTSRFEIGKYNADLSVASTDTKGVKDIEVTMKYMDTPVKFNFEMTKKSWFETTWATSVTQVSQKTTLLEGSFMYGMKEGETHLGLELKTSIREYSIQTTPFYYKMKDGKHTLLQSINVSGKKMTLAAFTTNSILDIAGQRLDSSVAITVRGKTYTMSVDMGINKLSTEVETNYEVFAGLMYAPTRRSEMRLTYKNNNAVTEFRNIITYIPKKTLTHTIMWTKAEKQLDLSSEILPKVFVELKASVKGNRMQNALTLRTPKKYYKVHFNGFVSKTKFSTELIFSGPADVHFKIDIDLKKPYAIMDANFFHDKKYMLSFSKVDPLTWTLQLQNRTMALFSLYLHKHDANMDNYIDINVLGKRILKVSLRKSPSGRSVVGVYYKIDKVLGIITDMTEKLISTSVELAGKNFVTATYDRQPEKVLKLNFGGDNKIQLRMNFRAKEKYMQLVMNGKNILELRADIESPTKFTRLSVEDVNTAELRLNVEKREKFVRLLVKGTKFLETVFDVLEKEKFVRISLKGKAVEIRGNMQDTDKFVRLTAQGKNLADVRGKYTVNEKSINVFVNDKTVIDMTLTNALVIRIGQYFRMTTEFKKDLLTSVNEVSVDGKSFEHLLTFTYEMTKDSSKIRFDWNDKMLMKMKQRLMNILNSMRERMINWTEKMMKKYMPKYEELRKQVIATLDEKYTLMKEKLMNMTALAKFYVNNIDLKTIQKDMFLKFDDLITEVSALSSKLLLNLKESLMNLKTKIPELKNIIKQQLFVIKSEFKKVRTLTQWFISLNKPIVDTAMTIIKEFKLRNKTAEEIYETTIDLIKTASEDSLAKTKAKLIDAYEKARKYALTLPVPCNRYFCNQTVEQVLTKLKVATKNYNLTYTAMKLYTQIEGLEIMDKTIKEHIAALKVKIENLPLKFKGALKEAMRNVRNLEEKARSAIKMVMSKYTEFKSKLDGIKLKLDAIISTVDAEIEPLRKYAKFVYKTLYDNYTPFLTKVSKSITRLRKENVMIKRLEKNIKLYTKMAEDKIMPIYKDATVLLEDITNELNTFKVINNKTLSELYGDMKTKSEEMRVTLMAKVGEIKKIVNEARKEFTGLSDDKVIDKIFEKITMYWEKLSARMEKMYRSIDISPITDKLAEIKDLIETIRTTKLEVSSEKVVSKLESILEITVDRLLALVQKIETIEIAEPLRSKVKEVDMRMQTIDFTKANEMLRKAKDTIIKIKDELLAIKDKITQFDIQIWREKLNSMVANVNNKIKMVLKYSTSILKRDFTEVYGDYLKLRKLVTEKFNKVKISAFAMIKDSGINTNKIKKALEMASQFMFDEVIPNTKNWLEALRVQSKQVYTLLKPETVKVLKYYKERLNTILESIEPKLIATYNEAKKQVIAQYKDAVKRFNNFLDRYRDMTLETLLAKIERKVNNMIDPIKQKLVAEINNAKDMYAKTIANAKMLKIKVENEYNTRVVPEIEKLTKLVKEEYARLEEYLKIKMDLYKAETLKYVNEVKEKIVKVYEENKMKTPKDLVEMTKTILNDRINEMKDKLVLKFKAWKKIVEDKFNEIYPEIKAEYEKKYGQINDMIVEVIVPESKKEVISIINQLLKASAKMQITIIDVYRPYLMTLDELLRQKSIVIDTRAKEFYTDITSVKLPKYTRMANEKVQMIVKKYSQLLTDVMATALDSVAYKKFVSNELVKARISDIEKLALKMEPYLKDYVDEEAILTIKNVWSFIKTPDTTVLDKFVQEKLEQLRKRGEEFVKSANKIFVNIDDLPTLHSLYVYIDQGIEEMKKYQKEPVTYFWTKMDTVNTYLKNIAQTVEASFENVKEYIKKWKNLDIVTIWSKLQEDGKVWFTAQQKIIMERFTTEFEKVKEIINKWEIPAKYEEITSKLVEMKNKYQLIMETKFNETKKYAMKMYTGSLVEELIMNEVWMDVATEIKSLPVVIDAKKLWPIVKKFLDNKFIEMKQTVAMLKIKITELKNVKLNELKVKLEEYRQILTATIKEKLEEYVPKWKEMVMPKWNKFVTTLNTFYSETTVEQIVADMIVYYNKAKNIFNEKLQMYLTTVKQSINTVRTTIIMTATDMRRRIETYITEAEDMWTIYKPLFTKKYEELKEMTMERYNQMKLNVTEYKKMVEEKYSTIKVTVLKKWETYKRLTIFDIETKIRKFVNMQVTNIANYYEQLTTIVNEQIAKVQKMIDDLNLNEYVEPIKASARKIVDTMQEMLEKLQKATMTVTDEIIETAKFAVKYYGIKDMFDNPIKILDITMTIPKFKCTVRDCFGYNMRKKMEKMEMEVLQYIHESGVYMKKKGIEMQDFLSKRNVNIDDLVPDVKKYINSVKRYAPVMVNGKGFVEVTIQHPFDVKERVGYTMKIVNNTVYKVMDTIKNIKPKTETYITKARTMVEGMKTEMESYIELIDGFTKAFQDDMLVLYEKNEMVFNRIIKLVKQMWTKYSKIAMKKADKYKTKLERMVAKYKLMIKQKFNELKEKMVPLFKEIKENSIKLYSEFKWTFDDLKVQANVVYDALKTRTVALFNEAKAKIMPFIEKYKAMITPVYEEYKTKVINLYTEYKAKLLPTYEEYKTKVMTLYSEYKTSAIELYNKLMDMYKTGDFKALTEMLNSFKVKVVELVKKYTPIVKEKLTEQYRKLLLNADMLKKKLLNLYEKVKAAFTDLKNGKPVLEVLKPIIDAIKPYHQKLLGTVDERVEKLREYVKTIVQKYKKSMNPKDVRMMKDYFETHKSMFEKYSTAVKKQAMYYGPYGLFLASRFQRTLMKNIDLENLVPVTTPSSIAAYLGNGQMITFDNKFYKFPMEFKKKCSYVLATDPESRDFTLLAEKDAVVIKTSDMVITVPMKEGDKIVTHIKNDKGKFEKSAGLPIEGKSGWCKLVGQNMDCFFKESQFRVIVDLDNFVVLLATNMFNYGNVRGLLGTNNGEKYDEVHDVRRKVMANSINVVNSFELTKTPVCRIKRARPEKRCTVKPNDRCEELFKSDKSVLSTYFRFLNPEPFYQACLKDTASCANKKTTSPCKVASAHLLAVSQIIGFVPTVVPECSTMKLKGKVYTVDDEFITTPTKKLDIVLLTSLRPFIGKRKSQIIKLLKTAKNSLRKFDTRYAVVGFGGEGIHEDAHVHTTPDGEVFTNNFAQLQKVLLTLPYTGKDENTNDMFDAVSYAGNLNYRPGSTRIFIMFNGDALTAKSATGAYALEASFSLAHESNASLILFDRLTFKGSKPDIVSQTAKELFINRGKKNVIKVQEDFPTTPLSPLVKESKGAMFDIKISNPPRIADFLQRVIKGIQSRRRECQKCFVRQSVCSRFLPCNASPARAICIPDKQVKC